MPGTPATSVTQHSLTPPPNSVSSCLLKVVIRRFGMLSVAWQREASCILEEHCALVVSEEAF